MNRSPRGAKPAGARDLARSVLWRVAQHGAFGNRALSAALDRNPGLSDADRALATEIVYGVMRHEAALDAALEALADRGLGKLDPFVRVVLRVGAYQLLHLARVPAHAAVDDAVSAVKGAGKPGLAGLMNALLRKLAVAPVRAEEGADALGVLVERRGLPRWLADLFLAELGSDRALAFAEASARPAPMALRANTLRAGVDETLTRLRAERPAAVVERSPWVDTGLVARKLARLGEAEVARRGLVAVADVGAQVVAELCGAEAGEDILDACAGVGGKSAHLAALAGNRARIVAADVHAGKLRRAQAAFATLGVAGVTTTRADLLGKLPWAREAFDRVLLDAPCSGLGVLRRHPELARRLRPSDLPGLAARQGRMLDAVAPLVRPGGLLVYAVCTFDAVETRDVVAAFLAAHADFRVERPSGRAATLADGEGFVRTTPTEHDADAFFAVRLRRVR